MDGAVVRVRCGWN